MKTITYLATNQKNGKWYVGSTIQPLQSRIQQHTKNPKNDPFHNALRKNPESFTWGTLSDVDGDDRSHEQEILDTWHGSKYCYNLSTAASGICSAIAKVNGHKVMTERWKDQEWRDKISESLSQRWKNKTEEEKEEFRQMAVLRNKEMWEDEAFRSMMSDAVSEANSRRFDDPEYTGGHIRGVEATVITTGEVLVFRSIADLCRHFPDKDLHASKISAVCRKKRKNHKGLKARYLENYLG